MCDPISLTVAGGALMGGNMLLNSMAADNVQSKRNEYMAAEMERQRNLDQEAAALNAKSLGTYDNMAQQQADKQKSVADFYAAQNKGVNTAQAAGAAEQPIMPASSNTLVQADEKAQGDKVAAYGKQQQDALAAMRSFGDILGNNMRTQSQDAAQVGLIGGFKKGSQGVLPYELEAANHSADTLKMFGDLLGKAGTISMSAGIGNGLGGAGGSSLWGGSSGAPISGASSAGNGLSSPPGWGT